LYIVLDKKIPNSDALIDGKKLGQAEKRLAREAKRLGVRPLMEYFSVEDPDLSKGEICETPGTAQGWFTPEEGLKTIDALLAFASQTPALKGAQKDLEDCQRVLRLAKEHDSKWHLAIDY
jgi:hypothetical protein